MRSCSWEIGTRVPRSLLLPSEYGGCRVLRNVGIHLPDNAASGPRRLWYAYLYSSFTVFFFWMGGVHCMANKFCCCRALRLAASGTTIVENGTLVEYWLARKGRNAWRICDQCHFVHRKFRMLRFLAYFPPLREQVDLMRSHGRLCMCDPHLNFWVSWRIFTKFSWVLCCWRYSSFVLNVVQSVITTCSTLKLVTWERR